MVVPALIRSLVRRLGLISSSMPRTLARPMARTSTRVENLTGGAAVDTFTFTAALTGTASGLGNDDIFNVNGSGTVGSIAGGGGTDLLDVSTADNAVTVNLNDNSATPLNSDSANGFSDIEAFVGDNSLDTLVGANAGTAANGGSVYATTGENDGTIDGTLSYTDFANIIGGTSGDEFGIGHNVTGTVDGGSGNDELALSAGSVSMAQGGAGNDAFTFDGGDATMAMGGRWHRFVYVYG